MSQLMLHMLVDRQQVSTWQTDRGRSHSSQPTSSQDVMRYDGPLSQAVRRVKVGYMAV